jgi:DDE family transposase
MKDGRTHLAYKAEHAVDLDTEMIIAAPVYHADESDGNTIGSTVEAAQQHLSAADSDAEVKEVVADKGYHKNETLAELKFTQELRTYIAEPQQTRKRNWKNKPEEQRQAVTSNRRRIRGDRGRRLQRQRSEKAERSFAHVCETGGARRTWLWGINKVSKRHLVAALTHNLGIVMRRLFGFGTARSLQAAGSFADGLFFVLIALLRLLEPPIGLTGLKLTMSSLPSRAGRKASLGQTNQPHQLRVPFSTGC